MDGLQRIRTEAMSAAADRRTRGSTGAAIDKSAASSVSRRPRGAVVWSGLTGFVAGAICWHMLGFWSFVTEAVFFARSETGMVGTARQMGAAAKVQNRQPGSVDAGAAAFQLSVNCTAAAIDRLLGDVKPTGCQGSGVKFRPARNIARADRGDFGPSPSPTVISGRVPDGAAVGGWSARIETGSIDPTTRKAN